MTEKRYYKKEWEESYYIFDSNIISEDEFEERVEYEGYDIFVDSLTGSEIIDLLNENEQLKLKNRGLQSELEIQKADVNYANKISNELFDKCKQYEKERKGFESCSHNWRILYDEAKNKVEELSKENKELKKENEELKQVLGSILIEVKQQFSTYKTGEIRAFINPNSFNLISDVLREYGALKEWYE